MNVKYHAHKNLHEISITVQPTFAKCDVVVFTMDIHFFVDSSGNTNGEC